MKTGFIPPETIEEIQYNTDIVELISGYLTLRQRGTNYVGLCPFHSEKTPSFTVSPEKQIFYCFGCQVGGNVFKFIMEIEGLTFPEAVEKLADRAGITLPKQQLTEEQQGIMQARQSALKIHEMAANFYYKNLWSPQGEKGLKYLLDRGLSKNTIKKFALGYAPQDNWEDLYNYLKDQGFNDRQILQTGLISQSRKNNKFYDRFRSRVIFPIQNHRGEVIAFGGRIIGEGEPKYLNSPETMLFNKSQHLYGLNLSAQEIRQKNEVVLMEGYMDVIMAYENNVTNSVATLGTALTGEHGKLLQRYCEKVLIAFDPDLAGSKATLRGMNILADLGFDIKVLILPQNLDPDDYLREYGKIGWEKIIQETALGFMEYKMKIAIKKHDISTVTGKVNVVEELLPEIRYSKSPVERDAFIRSLGDKLELAPEVIYADLQKKGLKIKQPRPIYKRKQQTKKSLIETGEVSLKQEVGKNLLAIALEDQTIFEEVEKTIGWDFLETTEKEIINAILEKKAEYNWQGSSLYNFLNTDESKNLLLNLMAKDIELGFDAENKQELAADYIKTIKIFFKEEQIEELKALIRSGTANDLLPELSKELVVLKNQIIKLRS